MVGLAFESRDSWLAHKTESKMATSGAKLSEMEEKEPLDVHPGFMDVYHYAFCYVGVLTGMVILSPMAYYLFPIFTLLLSVTFSSFKNLGPYFRYNTYRDMINTPFAKFAPCWEATVERLVLLPFSILAFLCVNSMYPNKVNYQVTHLLNFYFLSFYFAFFLCLWNL